MKSTADQQTCLILLLGQAFLFWKVHLPWWCLQKNYWRKYTKFLDLEKVCIIFDENYQFCITILQFWFSGCLTNLVVASSSFIRRPFMCHDVSCTCKKFEWMVWGRSCPLLSSMTWSSATQESVIMPILSSLLIYIVTKGLEIVCTSGVISKII